MNREDGWQQRINIWRMLLTEALSGAVWTWVAAGDQRARLHSWKWVFFSILKLYHDLNWLIKGLPYMACYSTVALSVSLSLSLPLFGCNSSLLFNKQFVSDVLNASYNLIVCDMCAELAAGCLPPSLYEVTHAWLLLYVCRDEDEGAILKGLQLHLNGIIRHDGWRLPFHNV